VISAHFEQNEVERARLFALLDRLSEHELLTVVHDEWTVSAKLAHLAFWDRLALVYFGRWMAGHDIEAGVADWYEDVLNDVVPQAQALAPSASVRLVREAASAIDAAIAALDAPLVERLTTEGEWLLRRHRHRREHLDEIDQALAVPAK
jgi:hypothetical protein